MTTTARAHSVSHERSPQAKARSVLRRSRRTEVGKRRYIMPRARYVLSAVGVKLGGASQSNRVTLQAVAKGNVGGPYCVANELICAEIGRFLYLPIPPGGIIAGPDQKNIAAHGEIYASLDFNLTGNDLPPVDTTRCVKLLPDESTGLVVFDIFIANSDRHAQNFAVDFEQLAMSVFDHSHAFFGPVANRGLDRLREMRDRLAITGSPMTSGNRHCLLDKLETADHLEKWISRVKEIPNFLIEEICREAGTLGISQPEVDAAIDFLKHRRATIGELVKQHSDEFRGIMQWPLTL